ncbi:3-hydroxybutyryl-CoA dehydrogenase [Aciditerrimonas ferrireducens]|uniref:3-hydroxybutyryl-CoA dehydrogenase n=1 Tax=Aciditerrimonas ferrireducens TaxID=667306 RepID=A0ABV6C4M3_9ACTN
MAVRLVRRAGVLGCGLMGSGIAEVLARAGVETTVVEVDRDALARGRARVEASLARAVSGGKLSGAAREEALANLVFSTDLGDLAEVDCVLEAIVEDEAAKLEAYRRLDKVVENDAAFFASNTSSIPIMKLAVATSRPEQVLGLHFFNPVPVMRLVEVISSLVTSEETREQARFLATEQLGKRAIASPDRAGFVVNALLIPYLLSSVRMLESGFATREDIDAGMVEGCGHPMGPLALLDLIGLDTAQAVAESLYEEFKEPLYAPPPLLNRMVEAGLLGRKSGQGFYGYRQGG